MHTHLSHRFFTQSPLSARSLICDINRVCLGVLSSSFDFAFDLARLACKEKIPEIHLKHALYLEDEVNPSQFYHTVSSLLFLYTFKEVATTTHMNTFQFSSYKTALCQIYSLSLFNQTKHINMCFSFFLLPSIVSSYENNNKPAAAVSVN